MRMETMNATKESPHAGQPVRAAGVSIDAARAAVVLVHGRGATAESMLALARELDVEGVAFRAPQAAGHTWYPHSFLAPLQANEPHLTAALELVGRGVEELERGGVPAERIVLLGFSQGACLASEYVARHARRYGGLVAFSGGLIGSEQASGEPPHDKLFAYDGSLDGTPAFFGCSDRDPHIPQARVEQSAETFGELGADVEKRIYPGMGHTVNQDEMAYVRDLLKHLHRT